MIPLSFGCINKLWNSLTTWRKWPISFIMVYALKRLLWNLQLKHQYAHNVNNVTWRRSDVIDVVIEVETTSCAHRNFCYKIKRPFHTNSAWFDGAFHNFCIFPNAVFSTVFWQRIIARPTPLPGPFTARMRTLSPPRPTTPMSGAWFCIKKWKFKTVTSFLQYLKPLD